MINQEDLKEIYNNLTEFSKTTVQSENPKPIKVWYDKGSLGSPLVFEQGGITVRLRLPIYYCLGLESLIKPSYLLPWDYDYLMGNLLKVINDSRSLDERTCLGPENYGFDIYAINPTEFNKGLDRIGTVRFVSGNSWIFKLYVRLRWRLK